MSIDLTPLIDGYDYDLIIEDECFDQRDLLNFNPQNIAGEELKRGDMLTLNDNGLLYRMTVPFENCPHEITYMDPLTDEIRCKYCRGRATVNHFLTPTLVWRKDYETSIPPPR